MKINLKLALPLLLTSITFSCSSVNPVNEVYIDQVKQSSLSEFKISDKQGATISFNISTSSSSISQERGLGGEFSTKANANGIPAKNSANIDHYIVYLIKNTGTGAYAGTDPLNSSNIVAGPFTISNAGVANKTVRFANVQPVTGAYYVAVRAQDNTNADLIKINNGSATAWTGTTAATPFNGRVGVSTGNGVTVSNSYEVSSSSPDVSLNLLNAVGARIDANIIPNSGVADTVSVSPI